MGAIIPYASPFFFPQHLKKQGHNHLVIVVDDDTIYPPRMVETFLDWHKVLPDAALALRGWVVHSDIVYIKFADSYMVFGNELDAPHPVSIITANCAYMVQTAFFDKSHLWDYHDDVPDGARWMDDVWISGQLARRSVPRMVVPFNDDQYTWNSWLPTLTLDQITLRRAPKYQRYRGTNPREAANNQALSYFMNDWDVLWEDGYRITAPKYGIEKVIAKRTSTFAGVNVMKGGLDADDPVHYEKRRRRMIITNERAPP